MTTVNRTPFRHMKDIPTTMRASGKLRWDTIGGDEAVFTSDGKWFAVIRRGTIGNWWDAFGSSAVPLRPLNMAWGDAEAIVWPLYRINNNHVPAPQPSLPENGDKITVARAIAVVREGCRQALDEALSTPPTAGKGGSFSQPIHQPHRTVIAALPPGRRKYVKLFLKGLGFRNLDEIPTTIEQKPYDLGRSFLSSENREKLISLAPNIMLRDVP